VCRLVGASVGAATADGLRLVRTGRIDVVQAHYNLLQQGAAAELLDEAHARGVGVIASVPLAYGFLSGRYTRSSRFPADDWRSRLTPEELAARADRVAELRFLCGDGTRTLLHASLQFVLAHPAVSTTIPGFKSAEQVEELVAAPESVPLSDIEVARARELGRPAPRAGARS
jgi:aryl-alcohol dehydrogenase-like predicted oxidoreductase